MTQQHTAPFLRLLLPFCIGIYTGLQMRTYAGLPLAGISLLCLLIVLGSCLLSFWRLSHGYKTPSLLSHLLLVLSGFLTALSHYAPAHNDHYTRFKVPPEFVLHITEAPREGKGFSKFEAQVEALLYPGSIRQCSGTVLLYIKHDDSNKFKTPCYGDLIRISGRLQDIPSKPYPEAFDYGAMMQERGITHRIFVDENQIKVAGNHVNPLKALAHKAASWTEKQLQQHFHRRIAAILASLLIGLRNDIEMQDIAAFKNTGTLHVLAVSGMHIALIFQALMWLTGLLPSTFPNVIRLILVALVIWAYACISGFSASVCRAAVMCSIMLLGKVLKKESSLANSLCASAFILLLWEPRWLIDAGFLLSFTAVAGIIAFQPLISEVWKPNSAILKLVRDLLSVSCAAQLGTLPVSLYFFHQFASYFLLGNLVIIPLSTISLFGGLAYLALGSLAIIGPFIREITAYCTSWMLDIAAWIGHFPYALVEGSYQTIPEASLLAVFLGGCAWYLYGIRSRKLWLILGSLLLFMGTHAYRNYQEQYHQEAIIYSRMGKVWTLLFHRGRNSCVLSNDTASKQRALMQDYLQRYRLNPDFYQWNGTHKWVQITLEEVKTQPENTFPGHLWKAKGMSAPANTPGIYILNGPMKASHPIEHTGRYYGRIILDCNSPGTFLHPNDTL